MWTDDENHYFLSSQNHPESSKNRSKIEALQKANKFARIFEIFKYISKTLTLDFVAMANVS